MFLFSFYKFSMHQNSFQTFLHLFHTRKHKSNFIFFFGIREVLVCLFDFQNQPINKGKKGKHIHAQHRRKQRTTITMSRMPHQGIPGPSLSFVIAGSSSVVVRGAPFYSQGYIMRCKA